MARKYPGVAICTCDVGASPMVSTSRPLIWTDQAPKPLANGSERMQKTIRVDRARKRRADLTGRLNVVLFMPQDVELVSGPPTGRRRYLDITLCQVDGDYCTALERYNEALRQRNAALRHLRDRGGDPAQLAPFEEVLAREGVTVTNVRRELVAALSQRAGTIH